MKSYVEKDSKKGMEVRKTLHYPKSSAHDKVLMERIQQCRSEVLLSGPMLTAQAKVSHKELHFTTLCDYSTG